MKEILTLMRSDFIIMKKKVLLPCAIAFLAIFIFSMCSSPMFPLFIIPISGFAIQPIFHIENESQFNKFYGVLPVKKHNIVVARYVIAFVIMIIFTISAYLSSELICRISIAPKIGGVWAELYESSVIVKDGAALLLAIMLFVLGALMAAYEYAIIYIFDITKQTSAALIGSMVSAGAVFAAIKVFDLNIVKFIKSLSEFYSEYELLFYGICILSGFLIFALAALISIIFFRKKEL